MSGLKEDQRRQEQTCKYAEGGGRERKREELRERALRKAENKKTKWSQSMLCFLFQIQLLKFSKFNLEKNPSLETFSLQCPDRNMLFQSNNYLSDEFSVFFYVIAIPSSVTTLPGLMFLLTSVFLNFLHLLLLSSTLDEIIQN